MHYHVLVKIVRKDRHLIRKQLQFDRLFHHSFKEFNNYPFCKRFHFFQTFAGTFAFFFEIIFSPFYILLLRRNMNRYLKNKPFI